MPPREAGRAPHLTFPVQSPNGPPAPEHLEQPVTPGGPRSPAPDLLAEILHVCAEDAIAPASKGRAQEPNTLPHDEPVSHAVETLRRNGPRPPAPVLERRSSARRPAARETACRPRRQMTAPPLASL